MSSDNEVYKTIKEWCKLNKNHEFDFDNFDEGDDGSLIYTREEFEYVYSLLGGDPDQIGWTDEVTHVKLHSIKTSEDGSKLEFDFSTGYYIEE